MSNPEERLRAALAEARDIYDGRDETPAGEAGRIAGVVNTVHALVDYLREIDVPKTDRDPLLKLLAAFRDHNDGKPNSLFKVRKKGGRRTHSTDAAWHATVAAAVTLLQRAGKSKADAIETVANKIRVKTSTVESWHRVISTRLFHDKAIIDLYWSTLNKAREVHPDAPARAASQLLEALPQQKL